ncbi:unnamed protein product [Peniophora sp. CBMAI 1063]|nr:unnamed protein product [Peniophora sp. CBMAI 1063]
MLAFPFALALVLATLSALLYSPSSTVPTSSSFPSPNNTDTQRVLLLTAHPDDEAFFFGPTLSALGRVDGVEVYSLCLSVGDGDGDGVVRVGELGRSLDVLGVEEGRKEVVDKAGLKDDINTVWDASLVAHTVLPFVLKHNITTILTFDNLGISSHPNHRSLYTGTRTLLAFPSTPPSLRAHALLTVPLPIKYISLLSALQAKFDILVSSYAYLLPAWLTGDGGAGVPVPVFVAGTGDWMRAVRAVVEHKSQMRWFRWLNLVGSRYFWVNEWVEVRAAAVGKTV